MFKNAVIVVLVIALLGEGYVLMNKSKPANVQGAMVQTASVSPSPRPSGQLRPPLLTRGDNLTTSAMMQYAYKIAPGPIPAASQAVLIGFTIKSTTLANGSTQVDLVPKDSDDQFQSYVLKPGNSLYFVEMTPVDDKQDADKDMNYRDDYGIVVDANGIIQ